MSATSRFKSTSAPRTGWHRHRHPHRPVGQRHLGSAPNGQSGRTLVASPAYLKRFGTPKSVADLDRHRLIANSASPVLNRWPLKSADKDASYQVRGHTRTDNSAVVLALVRQGIGMARMFDLYGGPLVRNGELVPLLQDQIDNQPIPIYAVMLQEHHRLPKIRACIDYWAEWIGAITKMAQPRNSVAEPTPSAKKAVSSKTPRPRT